MSSMRLRHSKRKICEEEEDKNKDVAPTRRKAASNRQTVAAAASAGPSPAKKRRTSVNRPRVAGNKIPHFLLEENGDKNSKGADNSQPEDGSDEYDFNNVEKAVALTLAEASQNDSGTPCKDSSGVQNGDAQNGDQAKDGSGEEVSGEAAIESVAKRKRKDRAATATEATSPRKTNRRPPSKRIKMIQQEREIRAEEARNAERDLGAVEDGRPKTRGSSKSKKPKPLFSGAEENSGLDTLATLADLSLQTIMDEEGKVDAGQIHDLVSSVLSSVKKEHDKPSELSPEAKKKQKRLEKMLETSTRLKEEAIVYNEKNGRPRRMPSRNKRNADYVPSIDENPEESQDDGPKTRAKKRPVNGKTSEARSKRKGQGPYRCSHTTTEVGPQSAQVRLLHMLSSKEARQWCIYEWLYSAIDLPWFARNEFTEYLTHARVGHVSRLTRTEWSVIRNSLGKPRLFSDKFVQGEREKLDAYRENVRAYYQDMRSGVKQDVFPPDLARPLVVSQRVTAQHPKTKGLHDGAILTVDRNRCRVQFDRPDLGVEFVLDINAMPVDPVENMSEFMKRRRVFDISGGNKNLGATRAALNDRLDWAAPGYIVPSAHFLNTLGRQAQTNSLELVKLAKEDVKEAKEAVEAAARSSPHAKRDLVLCLAEFTRQLEKKQALVLEIQRMNDETSKPDDTGRPFVEDDNFRTQLATVVVQLQNVNKQITTTLTQLRQFNTFQENQVPPWHSPSAFSQEAPCSGLSAGSPAEEITLSTRKDARTMVSAVVQEVCCKKGEDDPSKQGKAPNGLLGSNANHEQQQQHPDQLNNADKGDGLQSAGTTNNEQEPMPEVTFSTEMATFIPTELVASCIATLLVIQTCTEKPLPPSDVAVMLENLAANLRPKAAKNVELFKEIEQCFDVIKNQVTAQVSFNPNSSLPVDCHMR